MKKVVAAALAAMSVCAVTATAAIAGPLSMASGFGQSADGAAVGFTAKDDETGSFNYVGMTEFEITLANGTLIPVGSTFNGHCFKYAAVRFFDRPDLAGAEARLFARCRGFFFVDGGPPIRATVYLQAHVIDRGEPGALDRAFIAWGLNPSPGKGKPGVFILDNGVISNGNVQVKP